MLHHQFVSWDDLFKVDGVVYQSFTDAFRVCNALHNHPRDYYTDLPRQDENNSYESGNEEECMDSLQQDLADFVLFARRRPGLEDLAVLVDDLGTRNIDRSYNWSFHVNRHPLSTDSWTQIKAENPIVQAVTMDSCPQNLNPIQKKLYSVIVDQYIAEPAGGPLPRPLLLNVDGVVGSSKIYALLTACSQLQVLAQTAGVPDPVFRAAPTGIAAFNFFTKTLHSPYG